MDCLYIIKVNALPSNISGQNRSITVTHHLNWLKKNKIKNYRWKWTEHNLSSRSRARASLTFRFENEQDKIYFALKWS